MTDTGRTIPAPPASAEAVFLDALPRIERIIGIVCARNGLAGADAEDFGSHVKLKLIEDDYAVLRKHGGRSSVPTYLSVVIANIYRDWRVAKRGRWRASAAAVRLGRAAERLERLVYRDGHSFREAAEAVRAAGESAASDRELAELFGRLPPRVPMRPAEVDEAAAAHVAGSAPASAAVEQAEEAREREALRAALAEALATLPPEDRLIVRMRFWEGLGIAAISRALGLEQKPLYRRMERLLRQLREGLEEAGLGAADALRFLELPEADDPAPGAGGDALENRPSRPSRES
jgi:RNA polymerase sigma factor (sigma-70 family)